jgi:hypothetical protein
MLKCKKNLNEGKLHDLIHREKNSEETGMFIRHVENFSSPLIF